MMSDTQQAGQGLQPRRIKGINRVGLLTLVHKETARFLAVYTQTLVAPVVTMLLFYAVFALAFGAEERTAAGLPYLQFLAPGLIMMTMAQNAFANTSSSLMISKVQGNIVDVLMPPLGVAELFAGYAIGGVLRGLCVGIVCWLSVVFFLGSEIQVPWAVFVYSFLGTFMMSVSGIAAGIWSEKFDHIAAVTNFIVTPLTFLSGTFYSMSDLPHVWQIFAHFNPFYYMIDGFRYGFTGHADHSLLPGIGCLVLTNIILCALSLTMLCRGYKIKS